MPVTDQELRAGLQRALGRPVAGLRRRAHPYASTHPVEEVEVTVAGGAPLRLVLKDLAGSCCGDLGERAALLDPRREIEAYALLGGRVAGAPACHVAAAETPGDGAWIVLDAVDGVPLWQRGDLASWRAAARWLSRLHAGGPPAGARHLLRYDAPYLRPWLSRAVAVTPPGVLDDVAAVWDQVVSELAAWPATLVHGEFYPSNILVAGTPRTPRVHPVDWEMAGVGPGILDLAALVSGRWSAAEREQMARAYHRALPSAGRPAWPALTRALTHARLHVAVRWLGCSPAWTPPPAHAHDWLGEARTLAREVAP
jgi:Ser/Thr protein kinase RdoA (MazF antagonist)